MPHAVENIGVLAMAVVDGSKADDSVADRVMYGSDWPMLSIHPDW
jgi:predicted TIM-barrel fold metal-dependent hydrolase